MENGQTWNFELRGSPGERRIHLPGALPGVDDTVDHGDRRQHRDYPQHRRHGIEQGSDYQQHQTFRALHETDLAATDERLRAGASITNHDSADHRERSQHYVEKTVASAVKNKQSEKERSIAVAVDDGIEEASEARDLV